MNPPNDPILAQLRAEYAAAQARQKAILSQLEARLAYLGADLPSEAQKPVKATEPAKVRQRSPRGELARQIVGLLGEKGQGNGLTASEIREQLKVRGYPYSLDPIYFSKTLGLLSQGNKISSKVSPGNIYRYFP